MAAEQVPPPAVCLVVPAGSHRPEPLAAAIRSRHPVWPLRAVWCGDPQLRPTLGDGLGWTDPSPTMAGAHVEHVLAGDEAHRAEWRIALAVVDDLLAEGASGVVVLWVGAVAVNGPLSALEPSPSSGSQAMVVVERAGEGALDDGLHPDDAELVASGPYSTTVASFADRRVVDWLAARLADPASDAPVGWWLARAAAAFGARVCTDASVGVGAWRWASADPAVIDLPGFDARRPWLVDASPRGAARVELVGAPDRRQVMEAVLPQLTGSRAALCLPGGLVVDDLVRSLVRGADPPPPLPWTRPAEFRAWLATRYWRECRRTRVDLAAAFPDPNGADRAAFADWCRGAFAADDVPFLLPAGRAGDALTVAEPLATDGVNVVGYLRHDFSLGDVARRVLEALADADVPVAPIAYDRSASPVLEAPPASGTVVGYDTTLAVVNADQFAGLTQRHPELRATRLIGYWFWELEHVPQAMRAAFGLVDEVWAGSRFVAEAFRAVSPVPVRHVALPVPEPVAADRDRASFPPFAGARDRFVFLVTLDHLSVTARKNPLGAIEAFRRAFAPDEGPLLVVKSTNGTQRWAEHQAVRAAAEDRDDVVVWDEHLARADQMALVRSADCLVSLHRSEGLGLHLAEAMWLGVPVIATRYSGNLDLMDDGCAVLVDAGLVAVEGGQGVYPSHARWADPDLDQAAAAMRALAADPARGRALAAAARLRMQAQPSLRDTGAAIASALAEGRRR